MAIVRKSLNDIMTSSRTMDHAKIAATSDENIAEQIAGDPDTAPELTLEMLTEPANLRRRLGLSEERFAEALGVPLATVRDWEQGLRAIDPAARSLLILVARDPETTLAALEAARTAA